MIGRGWNRSLAAREYSPQRRRGENKVKIKTGER
jgi:hypothetical protein